MDNNLIEMGTCYRPHGIKGGFLFNLYNTADSQLTNGIKVTLVPISEQSSINKAGEVFTIKSISFGNKTICYLEEIEDRNKVESLLPFKIFLERKNFKELNDDEVYLSDLEGIDVNNQNGEKIGTVKTFYDHGATPILVISLLNKESIELPFVEAFFPELNLEQKYIVMLNPEEL